MYYGGNQATQGYGVPSYGYGCCEPVNYCCQQGNNSFALILVLFILLVIIGCTCFKF
ncbi:MAG: hypothetical protein K0Q49_1095 [Haloplasmataceae bacterium]|jgi:uncharacterized protein (TIGR01732 family)|nr:hypothetical protein [Haloplasmataceae bacterium]